MQARHVLASVLVLATGCPSSSSRPAAPTPASDTAALCADLATLVNAAAGNFVDQRTATAVSRDGQDGVEASHAVTGTAGCVILHPSPAYPDDLVECELGAAGTSADARAVLAAWTPRVAGCAVIQGWASHPGADGSQSWEQETGDNHLLAVQLELAGDEPSVRPVLHVRRPEI